MIDAVQYKQQALSLNPLRLSVV